MPENNTYLLDRYRPQPVWFTHNPFGIHGLGHVARVLAWADQVGQALCRQGASLDLEAVRWAASLHDLGRVDDGRDRPHGGRSAAWVKSNLAGIAPTLSPEQIAQVAYLCAWHVPDDRAAPDFSPELICLKDADALDRVRIHDLDPRRLRTSHALALVAAAESLFRRSVALKGDPWNAVRSCALAAGFWH